MENPLQDNEEEAGTLSPEQVRIGMAAADCWARRIGRSLQLPAADISDVRQDLLLALLRRSQGFDGRAGWSTFVHLVIRHAGQDLADRLVRQRARHGGSIDEWVCVGERMVPRHAVLAEEDGIGAWWSGGQARAAAIDLGLDVERFVAALPQQLHRLCRLIAHETPPAALAQSGLSRSEFYRRTHELRMRLRSFGLSPPLGRSDASAGT